MLLYFLPLTDCILKIGEALGEVLVKPLCIYTDLLLRGHQQGLGLSEKPPVPTNKPVLTRMVGIVALSAQGCIVPLISTSSPTNKVNHWGQSQINSQETRINVLLECDGNVGNQGFYMYFLFFLPQG